MGCHTWFLNGLTKSKLEELRSEFFIGYTEALLDADSVTKH